MGSSYTGSRKLQETSFKWEDEYREKAKIERLSSQLLKMLQILQKPQLQGMVSAADLRERDAKDSQNSSDSSDSEWLLAVSDWLLACRRCRLSRQCRQWLKPLPE